MNGFWTLRGYNILCATVFLVLGIGQTHAENRAKTFHHFYGADLPRMVAQNVGDQALKSELHDILAKFHVHYADKPDSIVDHCEANLPGCDRQRLLSYKEARYFLFGELHLEQQNQQYVIRDVYCQRYYGPHDFPGGGKPGPGQIPDAQILNAEHTWPQSRFSAKYPDDLQKGDLHHLFPTGSHINEQRGNLTFGEVNTVVESTCNGTELGIGDNPKDMVFEPPAAHRGNAARALFYFSIRYSLPIDPSEERALKKWHVEDPVDAAEAMRGERIFVIERQRNPFIDHPELVDMIGDF